MGEQIKGNFLQRKWIRWTSTVLVLGIMTAIFIFSSHGQEQSEGLSFPVGDAAMQTGIFDTSLFSGIRDQYAKEGVPFWLFVQRLVRKLAHVVIFMALGGSILICLRSWLGDGRLMGLWSWLIGTLYAVSDEWHQSMVPGRSGSLEDVLLDSGGVLLGVLLTALILKLIRKRIEKKKQKESAGAADTGRGKDIEG